MSRKKYILIGMSTAFVIVLVIILLPTVGVAQWSGYADVTIVLQVVDAKHDPIEGCSVELRVDADLYGSKGELEWKDVTNNHGIVTLTREFSASGTRSRSIIGERNTVRCGWHSRVFSLKADGYASAQVALWAEAPAEFVNPAYPIVVPIQVEMHPCATNGDETLKAEQS